MVAIPGFYEKPRTSARRFEVEDLARKSSSSDARAIVVAAPYRPEKFSARLVESGRFHARRGDSR
jgi:hypothetical protein